MVDLKILNKETFSKQIMEIVGKKKMSAMEAILYFCEKANIEVETIAKLIDKSLKEKIEFEATNLKLLRSNSSVLPI